LGIREKNSTCLLSLKKRFQVDINDCDLFSVMERDQIFLKTWGTTGVFFPGPSIDIGILNICKRIFSGTTPDSPNYYVGSCHLEKQQDSWLSCCRIVVGGGLFCPLRGRLLALAFRENGQFFLGRFHPLDFFSNFLTKNFPVRVGG